MEQTRQKLTKALAAIPGGIGDTQVDKALSRQKEQAVIYGRVMEGLIQAQLLRKNVEQRIYLVIKKDGASKANEVIKSLGEWEKFLLDLNQKKELWKDTSIRERDIVQNILAIEIDNGGNQELKKVNIERSELAGETILSIQRLENSIQDIKLLTDLLAKQLPAQNGNLETWFLKSNFAFTDFVSKVYAGLTISLFKINDTPVTALGLIRVLMILGLAWWFSRFMTRLLERFIESREGKDLSGVYTLGRLIHYGILTLGLFIALSSIGLDLSSLALVAGALSVGIRFGLQSIVNNFVSGLILLFERNIKVGNFIEISNGITGVVKEINVRTTLINTNDNTDIILPNSELVGSNVINWTLREAVRRIRIPFGVAYGSDKDLVKKAGLEAADKVPHTYIREKRRAPQVWLVGFGDSSLNFELVVWITPEMVKKPGKVHAEYMWEIESALGKYGIEIPFPQRDLHLKSGFQNLLKKDLKDS